MRFVLTALLISLVTGCTERTPAGHDQNMIHQPRYNTFEASPFFADGASARRAPAGTVSRTDPIKPSNMRPDIDLAALERGRERFDIYCSVCHGRDGRGRGMIVQRGFPKPPTFHDNRLRALPDEHLYQVITNGLGTMPAYAGMIPTEDRWKVIAYVRALQLSRHAEFNSLNKTQQKALEQAKTKNEATDQEMTNAQHP
jgi:mono/diheme cytochrome c family protein